MSDDRVNERPVNERMVPLAVIVGAHGVTGEVRLKLFGEGPESLRHYQSLHAGARALTLKSVRPGPNGAVARFAEVPDRNAAEALRGTELCVPRSSLPPLDEGEYYHFDLIGLPCVDESGALHGSVTDVQNFGAGDIIEIEKADGRRVLVPVHALKLEEGHALVDPLFLD